MIIFGSCHCGNISFALDWKSQPSEISARACTCTFCTKHGGVWTSCPEGTLTIAIKDLAHASRYAFGTMTAQFHICTHCGVVPVATSTIDEHIYAVVNVNTFQNVDDSLLKRSSSTLDGENTGDRLARRKRNWIADVHFTETL